jgi:hypothetical protein
MTVEADLFSALKGLVSNRVYPDVAPSGAVAPYITYQSVGGAGVNFLESAVPSKENGRFQINCWADTRAAASALSKLARNALVTSDVLRATAMGGPISNYDEDTLLYGTMRDFSIWFDA